MCSKLCREQGFDQQDINATHQTEKCLLWKTITDEAAVPGGESRNCETFRSFKFPASGNFAANLSFLRPENLKLCPNWAKIPPD
jgi:hypothetical protein